MKNRIILIVFLTTLLLSCKNQTESKILNSQDNTIKNAVMQRENEITWSKEVDSYLLDESIKAKKLSDDVVNSVELMKVMPDFQKAIYPEFENFGKLDISSLNSMEKENIKNLCSEIAKGTDTRIEQFFNRQYIFNYVFFQEELKNDWKTYFGCDFPSEIKDDEKLFDKWLYGEPFLGEEIIQIPVRFYCIHGTVDVTLYLNKARENSIYQITINRWAKV